MKLSNINNDWVGVRIRDRVDMKNGVVTDYSLAKKTVTIKFDDGELRTIPHHRDPNKHQPKGAFYTNRYWDGPTKRT